GAWVYIIRPSRVALLTRLSLERHLFGELFNNPRRAQRNIIHENARYQYLAFAGQQVAIVLNPSKNRSSMLFPAKISMTPAAEQLHSRAELLEPGHIAPFDLTVLISCYNERLYIIDTIETVHSALQEVGGINYEIIIIDDCSSDNSTDLVD